MLDRGSEICYSLRAVRATPSEERRVRTARPNLENDTERKKRARRKEAKRGTEARAGGLSEAEDSEDSEEFNDE